MEQREWNPGDDPILPEVDPSCCPPNSTPLPAVNTNLCWRCGNVGDPSSDSGLCATCISELT